MKIKKGDLTLFYQTLAEGRSNVEKDYISLSDARVRDNLATKIVFPILQEYEEHRKKIYETFCIKDKDGNPDMQNGINYQFTLKDGKKVTEEKEILDEEEVEIKVENPAKILIFLENTKYQPKIGEALKIDELIAEVAKELHQ